MEVGLVENCSTTKTTKIKELHVINHLQRIQEVKTLLQKQKQRQPDQHQAKKVDSLEVVKKLLVHEAFLEDK